jgi:hypothetical protein
MLCIICLSIKPNRTSSVEHVIPYSIGGSFTIDRVCGECNSRLGSEADAGLVRLSAIEQRRAELSLQGESGAVPDPERRELKKPLIGKHDAKHRILVRRDAETGELVTKTLPLIEFDVKRTPEGIRVSAARVYIDPGDVDKAEHLAKNALRKEGITDEDALEAISRNFAQSLEPVEESLEFERLIQLRVAGHALGLTKIAYEFAWYWLGDSWLTDPVAVAMRDTLAGENPKISLRGKIYDDARVGIVAMEGDQRLVHVAYLYPFHSSLIVMITLFDVLAAGLVVTENAQNYQVPHLNAIVMQTVQRRYEEVSFGP